MKRWAFIVTMGSMLISGSAAQKIIGTPAPEWRLTNWLNSPPLKLRDLKGKVVLVRWWTAPGCPYCSATAPALREFQRKYSDRGLEIVAIYHHKGNRELEPANVAHFAREYGLNFPVAVDPEWNTLRRWWLDRGDQDWTSVSFLLDRQGVIRYIHPGGQYVKGDGEFERMEGEIRKLLAQKGVETKSPRKEATKPDTPPSEVSEP